MRSLGLALALGLAAGLAWADNFTPAPMQPQPMPFTRNGLTYALPVGVEPQTYAVDQPDKTRSYRGVNDCHADIVVTSVTATAPITTEPVVIDGETIPNVRRVTSPTESVNRFTGTFFMARTGRNFGSSPNPAGGNTRYVSVMALSAPAKTCFFRMLYGMGY
ncbi:hypothetical protein C0214_19625 [Methylobacterium sp. DM1]|nr:hypothetical protein C0214_19625 [Methylobacterium sp. DM1]